MINQAINDLMNYLYAYGIILIVVGIIALIFLIRKHGKTSKISVDSDSSIDTDNKHNSGLRIRSATKVETGNRLNHNIRGEFRLIEKSTGILFECWMIPETATEAFRIYHATGGRLMVEGSPGDPWPPVMYFIQDGNRVGVNPFEVLAFDKLTGRFRVLKWLDERDKFILEL